MITVRLDDKQLCLSKDESDTVSLSLDTTAQCEFNQLVKILTGETFELLPPAYAKAFDNLHAKPSQVLAMLPRELLKQKLTQAQKVVSRILRDKADKEYAEQWSKVSKFLASMQRAKIDANILQSVISEHENVNVKSFETFLPNTEGYAKRVRYSTCDSTTGRITVVSGPQILTTHHDVRKCIVSSFDGGKVLSVDFTSVEPRIAMIETGKQPPEDVYADLLAEFPSLERPAAKLVMLAALYGGQPARIAETVGDIVTARKAIDFVKEYIGATTLEKMLSQQAAAGLVRNVLGRPLRDATRNPRVRTNHFLQSSAAELAPLLFSELCEKFDPQRVRPLFVIHDALLIDVAPECQHDFETAANEILWKNCKMPVKIETLSHI